MLIKNPNYDSLSFKDFRMHKSDDTIFSRLPLSKLSFNSRKTYCLYETSQQERSKLRQDILSLIYK